jgi:UDP-3-O-[3-hydroxymyristoyl] N-acetylglucosamine deacetylase
LDAEQRTLKVLRRVEFAEQGRSMSVEPSNKFEIECVIDFPHPFINRQSFHFVFENGSYGKQIASARTFGFEREIEMLRNANLALGGSLDNAIVLTEDGMLNEQPLRFDDEFVRHKILDIIGDVALLGMPLEGKIKAERSGHAIHAALMSKLLKTPRAWEIV